MNLTETPIQGLFIIETKVFSDERGYFFESYNKEAFKKNNLDFEFVQDNVSMSYKNTLRGLHFQNPPHAQGKLVSVIKGAVLDVAVDIRLGSPTYGKHFSLVLSSINNKSLWIPKGFAHGFLALEDQTYFMYKCTNFYNKESEDSLAWNDPDLNIDWGTQSPIVSDKDLMANEFKNFKSLF
ncbi:MAG: dTDP-4-dehydrorhamnose 3,5-epimerase [Bacteroidetes bacterium]|nr:dTDP-4-dehydrorhamnose 3,5-epimerase [Bacteroidota bacterium]HET6243605.1 dTDP-4-dehydrorhamnose 3,5-epimerase [Bacteroidia bacterium]